MRGHFGPTFPLALVHSDWPDLFAAAGMFRPFICSEMLKEAGNMPRSRYSGDDKPYKKAAATVQQTSDAIVAVNTTQVQAQNSQKLELIVGVRRISCNFL